ncbi:hypothetical protein IWQ61_001548 [Dispira simplex]|nr:hypothetical protein IWQ61_001548 [Dispira simplex]
MLTRATLATKPLAAKACLYNETRRIAKTWNELATVIASGDFTSLGRDEAAQRIYDQAKQHYDEYYGGIVNYVLTQRLKWSLDELRQLQHTLDPTRFYPEHTQLLPNDFPYTLEPEITHDVLWSKMPLNMDHPDLKAYLHRLFPDKDILFMIHTPALQSVGAVPHGHVFTRNKQVKGHS